MCWDTGLGGGHGTQDPQSRTRVCVGLLGVKWRREDQAREDRSQSGWCPSCPDASCLCIRTILWERSQGGAGCRTRMTWRDVFPI